MYTLSVELHRIKRGVKFIMMLTLPLSVVWTTMYRKFANCSYLGIKAVVLLAPAFRLQRGVVVGYDVTLGTGTPAKQVILYQL
jgi:hypothetical protein